MDEGGINYKGKEEWRERGTCWRAAGKGLMEEGRQEQEKEGERMVDCRWGWKNKVAKYNH